MQQVIQLKASEAGAVSQSLDISDIKGDWTLSVSAEVRPAGAKALLAVQDSVNDFLSDAHFSKNDVQTLSAFTPQCSSVLRQCQMASARFGLPDAKLRLVVQSIDAGAEVTASVVVQH